MRLWKKLPAPLLIGCCIGLSTVSCGEARSQNAPRKPADAPTDAKSWQQFNKTEAEKVDKSLLPVLKDPHFADVDWAQYEQGKAFHGYVFLPSEKPTHEEGIYRVRGFMATTYVTDPLEGSCSSDLELRVLTRDRLLLDEQTCKRIGQQFLLDHFGWFFKKQGMKDETFENPSSQPTATTWRYYFTWEKYDKEGFSDSIVDVAVRAIDGKVVEFGAVTTKGKENLPARKITPNEVRQIALREMEKEPLITKVTISKGVSLTTDNRTSEYGVGFKGESKNFPGHEVSGSIRINAGTGKPIGKPYFNEGNDEEERRRAGLKYPSDSNPVWTNQGLVFLSTHPQQGLPDWADSPAQATIIKLDGTIHQLTCDLKMRAKSANGLPDSGWLTVRREGFSYAVDLASGAYRLLAHPLRDGDYPAVDALGQRAIVCGNGRETKGVDFFSDDLNRGIDPKLPVRLVAEGDQHHPIFSPDGKWLYFITSTYDKPKPPEYIPGNGKHTLQRLPLEVLQATKLTKIDVTKIETVIADLPADAMVLGGGDEIRLSFFPNGEKMLLQGERQTYLLSLADKKVTPLKLENLQDAELGAAINRIRDGWAGPGDDRVTFSGHTLDKDNAHRQRIYSCKFDGSDVKAHTPKTNEPVPPYKFPGSDKTAIDVAKDWALREIAWDDRRVRLGLQ